MGSGPLHSFFFIFHFPRPLCEMKMAVLKWFSMSSLIGCKLKFQMDQSPTPKAEVCAKCQAAE